MTAFRFVLGKVEFAMFPVPLQEMCDSVTCPEALMWLFAISFYQNPKRGLSYFCRNYCRGYCSILWLCVPALICH